MDDEFLENLSLDDLKKTSEKIRKLIVKHESRRLNQEFLGRLSNLLQSAWELQRKFEFEVHLSYQAKISMYCKPAISTFDLFEPHLNIDSHNIPRWIYGHMAVNQCADNMLDDEHRSKFNILKQKSKDLKDIIVGISKDYNTTEAECIRIFKQLLKEYTPQAHLSDVTFTPIESDRLEP